MRCVAHLGERSEREEHVLGRVRSASELLRREERRVGLDQESIQRHGGGSHTQVLVLRIRHVACERGPVAARCALAREAGVAAEAVDHDALRRTLIQDPQGVGPRVADMHAPPACPTRSKGRCGSGTHGSASSAGRKHPEPVETALPTATTRGSCRSSSIRADGGRVEPAARRAGAPPRSRTHPRVNRRSRATGGSFRRPRRRSISRSTPEALAVSTATAGSTSIRNRWQWVSTAPDWTDSSGFSSAIGRGTYPVSTSGEQGSFT